MNKIKIGSYFLVCLLLGMGCLPLIQGTNDQSDSNNESGSSREIDWWPMSGHDPAHTRASSSTASINGQISWNCSLPPDPDPDFLWNSIGGDALVADGKIFVQGGACYYAGWGYLNVGKLWCFDEATGNLLWEQTLLYAVNCISYLENRIFVSAYYYNPDYPTPAWGYLCCLNATTGNYIWSSNTSYNRYGNFVISEGRIYAEAYFSDYWEQVYITSFICLDASNGTMLWEYILPEGGGFKQIPVVANGSVYSLWDHTLHCLDATNGTVKWNFTAPYQYFSQPMYSTGKIYFSSSDGTNMITYCLDAETNNGTPDIIWTETQKGWAGAISNGKIYLVDGGYDSAVNCLDAEGNGDGTTSVIWTYALNPSQYNVFSEPAVADGKIYLNMMSSSNPDSITFCLDAEGNGNGTTDVIWTHTFDDNFFGYYMNPPSIANGKLFISSNNQLICFFGDDIPPQVPSTPEGPASGIPGILYTFLTTTIDPDNDSVYYLWDWGDGSYSDWLGPYTSGEPVAVNHSWFTARDYEIRVKAKDSYIQSDWSEPHTITITNQQPDTPGEPEGPDEGEVAVAYTFTARTTDVENQMIYYWFDWNDGTASGWLGPYASGINVTASHSWSDGGEYLVKVKAKDIYDYESNWSEPHLIHIAIPPVLEIGNFTRGFWWVDVEIKNTGEVDARNVTWSLRVDGKIVAPFSRENTGTIPVLQGGETGTATSKPVFGLGRVTITVTAEAENATPVSKSIEALVILTFIIVPPL